MKPHNAHGKHEYSLNSADLPDSCFKSVIHYFYSIYIYIYTYVHYINKY